MALFLEVVIMLLIYYVRSEFDGGDGDYGHEGVKYCFPHRDLPGNEMNEKK